MIRTVPKEKHVWTVKPDKRYRMVIQEVFVVHNGCLVRHLIYIREDKLEKLYDSIDLLMFNQN